MRGPGAFLAILLALFARAITYSHLDPAGIETSRSAIVYSRNGSSATVSKTDDRREFYDLDAGLFTAIDPLIRQFIREPIAAARIAVLSAVPRTCESAVPGIEPRFVTCESIVRATAALPDKGGPITVEALLDPDLNWLLIERSMTQNGKTLIQRAVELKLGHPILPCLPCPKAILRRRRSRPT